MPEKSVRFQDKARLFSLPQKNSNNLLASGICILETKENIKGNLMTKSDLWVKQITKKKAKG